MFNYFIDVFYFLLTPTMKRFTLGLITVSVDIYIVCNFWVVSILSIFSASVSQLFKPTFYLFSYLRKSVCFKISLLLNAKRNSNSAGLKHRSGVIVLPILEQP